MKKLLFLLAFTLPLLAQDSTEVKEEAKQKKSWGKSVWMGVEDVATAQHIYNASIKNYKGFWIDI